MGERLEARLWGPEGHAGRVRELLGKSLTPYDVAEEILGSIMGVTPGQARTLSSPRTTPSSDATANE